MMTMIPMAIIDDGVHEDLYSVGRLHHNIEITPELNIKNRVSYDNVSPSHGTTCAAIIKKYAPNAHLISIKILNEKERGIQGQVIHALRWCIDNNVKLVNLSLGSIHYKDFDELKRIVRETYKRGVVIVAAGNNQDIYTCPASFSHVIGVKCDKYYFDKDNFTRPLKEGQYIFNPYPIDGVEITAPAQHFLTNNIGDVTKTLPSNSYAAPFITALVHNTMEFSPGITFEEIKNELREKAINADAVKKDTHTYSYDIDWVDNAITFYMKNETSAPPYYSRYSSKADMVIPIKCQTLYEGLDKIKFWLSTHQDSTSDFDTIIIVKDPGVEEFSYDRDMFNHGVSQFNKNIVWIDDEMEDTPSIFDKGAGIKIWHPGVYKYFKTNNTLNEEITTPIVVVYDMTKSGKYIHFLKYLEKIFRENGYFAVASVDTSIGILEGIEYASLPISYAKKPHINLERIHTIKKRYRPDIILNGISGHNKASDYFSLLENSLEIDIKIILCDENNIQYLIQDNGSSKAIVISTSKEINSGMYREISLFSYPEDHNFSEIYNCIIDLFKHEGLLSEEIPSFDKRDKSLLDYF